jgi:hypothetical protein
VLLEDVAAVPALAAGQLDFSQSGTFLYPTGTALAGVLNGLAWMDSSGKTKPLVTTPGRALTPRLSPDRMLLAFSLNDFQIFDPQRDANCTHR